MMRVIALLAAYNEERFIGPCLEHLFEQGVEAYLVDNCSTDRTTAIAEQYLGRGLVGVESFPRTGAHPWRGLLERKEQLAASLDADWFMHADPDEIRLPPRQGIALAQAFQEVEEQGYNAVNFMEFTFVPTRESPDHDHPDFQKTMRWYYPLLPSYPNRLNAWKRQQKPVELAWSAGHKVRFPGLRMYPCSFPMRHYLFLSIPHAMRKYGQRRHEQEALASGWHGWRNMLRESSLTLLPEAELHYYRSDDALDPSQARTRHYIADLVDGKPVQGGTAQPVRASEGQQVAGPGKEEMRMQAGEAFGSAGVGAATNEPGDSEWHRGIVGGLWREIGSLQYEFLVSQGLKPSHYLLDVGCGSLRGGVHFMSYLEDGHYYGVDKDSRLLEAARAIEMVRYGLSDRQVTLVRMEDFAFQSLGRIFDYALALSVFTHLPLDQITRCVVSMDKVLAPGGRFYATYFDVPAGKLRLDPIYRPALGAHTFPDADPCHYDIHTFEAMCEGSGLRVTDLGDWGHPRGQKMLLFTKEGTVFEPGPRPAPQAGVSRAQGVPRAGRSAFIPSPLRRRLARVLRAARRMAGNRGTR